MEWQTDPTKRLIIDNGSHNMRCGTASDAEPSLNIENIIGRDFQKGEKGLDYFFFLNLMR